ncbi:outer membrane beta-barrel protein [Caenimonas koreensis]|uniref:outer membrane beta-barrel protein n=1 Tax=Caenimonas koreensis TaxID=367474 RepID=UPI003783D6F7
MKASQVSVCLGVLAAALVALPVSAQTFQTQSSVGLPAQPLTAASSPWGRSYLGINVGRPRNTAACTTASLLCEDPDRTTTLYAGTMIGSFWGAEVAYVNSARLVQGGIEGRAQGLNLSLIGKTRLGPSLGLFGKVGTMYSRSDTSVIGARGVPLGADQGFGLSFGAGVSYDFTPRLSGRIEFDSQDLRFHGARDTVRSTNLGLQYRY